MSDEGSDEEDKICQLIEEYNEDADRERLLNQGVPFGVPLTVTSKPFN